MDIKCTGTRLTRRVTVEWGKGLVCVAQYCERILSHVRLYSKEKPVKVTKGIGKDHQNLMMDVLWHYDEL